MTTPALANVLALDVVAGRRLDLELDWLLASDQVTVVPMTGFTAVMNIFSPDGTALYTSTGDAPDIALTQNSGSGKINLTLTADLVAKLFVPYGAPSGWTYRIDLVDNSDADNIISFTRGGITVHPASAAA